MADITLSGLRKMGYSVKEILDWERYSYNKLLFKEAQYSIRELNDGGFKLERLVDAGFSIFETTEGWIWC